MSTFSSRDDILEPSAVVALGPAAKALAERLLAMSDERLRALRGVAGRELLAVTGASQSLPWVDGVLYLGRDPAAPRLLLPTIVRPSAPAHVLEAAIARHAKSTVGPWAVLVGPPRIVPLGGALPIERERLRKWLEAEQC